MTGDGGNVWDFTPGDWPACSWWRYTCRVHGWASNQVPCSSGDGNDWGPEPAGEPS